MVCDACKKFECQNTFVQGQLPYAVGNRVKDQIVFLMLIWLLCIKIYCALEVFVANKLKFVN